MAVTTQDQRDYAKQLADQVTEDIVPLSRRLAYGLACDADRLARIEQACLIRSEIDAPRWAGLWGKYEDGECCWFDALGRVPPLCLDESPAPDLLPDTPGPAHRQIVDVE